MWSFLPVTQENNYPNLTGGRGRLLIVALALCCVFNGLVLFAFPTLSEGFGLFSSSSKTEFQAAFDDVVQAVRAVHSRLGFQMNEEAKDDEITFIGSSEYNTLKTMVSRRSHELTRVEVQARQKSSRLVDESLQVLVMNEISAVLKEPEVTLRERVRENTTEVRTSARPMEGTRHSEQISRFFDSIVCISAITGQGNVQASGFMVRGYPGLVITTAHHLENVYAVFIRFNSGDVQKGYLVYRDTQLDLAVIKVFEGILRPGLTLADKEELRIGSEVITIGCPLGLANTVSVGVINSLDRKYQGIELIQTNVDLNPGSSGGPLISRTDKVVGIVKGKYSDGKDISFAIPAWQCLRLLNQAHAIDFSKERREFASVKVTAVDWYNYGVASKEPELKKEAYQEAIRLKPEFIEAHYNLSLSYAALRNKEGEIRELREVLKLRPDFFEAWLNLGIAYISAQSFDRALESLEKARELSPRNARTYNALGELYRRTQKADKALDAFQTALMLNSTYADAHYNIGILYEDAYQNWSKAVDHYRRYLELCPDSPDREQVEQWIRRALKKD